MKKTALIIALTLISVLITLAQPAKVTKEQLGQLGNELLNTGKQKEALELVDAYPEFADEMEVLYIKSVAYTELKDYKRADIYFQKQFDTFRANADSGRKEARDFLANKPSTKFNSELVTLMFGSSLISYTSAELVNSLRAKALKGTVCPPIGGRR